ncbi:ROK family protein [Tengunoibacter tsumagoiensis]|uniref:ROK family protein n=1 Tax=Tengunoibacter tsumagoiensis TaxID=2014871 RepID=UPI001386FE7C|nr:ROK family protein [Tengunoibacter tsumagoiensis]
MIGIDLGGTQIRTAVLRGATLLSRVNLLTGENPSPERVIPRMFESVEEALLKANISLSQIAGIGIGAPGPLNGRTGIVYSPPNLPGWTNFPLRNAFAERFQIPIFVENDANAAALGEHMFGAGKGSNEMVYVTVSTGVGGGVISQGQLLQGITGSAAELGHMTIDWHGPRCNCGNYGCLESFSSGTAIARQANELISLGKADDLLSYALAHQPAHASANTPADNSTLAVTTPLHVNARMVAEAALAGIPVAQQIITLAGEALGVGLVNILHIFNPELIILGGGVSQIGAPLLDPARRIMRERAMTVPCQSATIVMAQLGSDVGLVGAGSLVYYHQ